MITLETLAITRCVSRLPLSFCPSRCNGQARIPLERTGIVELAATHRGSRPPASGRVRSFRPNQLEGHCLAAPHDRRGFGRVQCGRPAADCSRTACGSLVPDCRMCPVAPSTGLQKGSSTRKGYGCRHLVWIPSSLRNTNGHYGSCFMRPLGPCSTYALGAKARGKSFQLLRGRDRRCRWLLPGFSQPLAGRAG
jgi:hypothetical protein